MLSNCTRYVDMGESKLLNDAFLLGNLTFLLNMYVNSSKSMTDQEKEMIRKFKPTVDIAYQYFKSAQPQEEYEHINVVVDEIYDSLCELMSTN